MWPYMEGRREVNNEDLYIQLPIFIGPCIVIYSYNTTNKMHLLSQIIYSCKTLYMFRTVFLSIIRSSKLRIQQRYTSNSCCYLVLAAGSSNCLTYSFIVYAVFSSWWLTERPSETCRAFYKNKQFEITGASCWLYYRKCTNSLHVFIPNVVTWFTLHFADHMAGANHQFWHHYLTDVSTTLSLLNFVHK